MLTQYAIETIDCTNKAGLSALGLVRKLYLLIYTKIYDFEYVDTIVSINVIYDCRLSSMVAPNAWGSCLIPVQSWEKLISKNVKPSKTTLTMR